MGWFTFKFLYVGLNKNIKLQDGTVDGLNLGQASVLLCHSVHAPPGGGGTCISGWISSA